MRTREAADLQALRAGPLGSAGGQNHCREPVKAPGRSAAQPLAFEPNTCPVSFLLQNPGAPAAPGGGPRCWQGSGCTEVNQRSFEEQEVDNTVRSLEENLVEAGVGGCG